MSAALFRARCRPSCGHLADLCEVGLTGIVSTSAMIGPRVINEAATNFRHPCGELAPLHRFGNSSTSSHGHDRYKELSLHARSYGLPVAGIVFGCGISSSVGELSTWAMA